MINIQYNAIYLESILKIQGIVARWPGVKLTEKFHFCRTVHLLLETPCVHFRNTATIAMLSERKVVKYAQKGQLEIKSLS